MRHTTPALRFSVLLLAVAVRGAAQEAPKAKELPDAPAPKQNKAPQQRENALNATIETLGRRSLFFPELATDKGPLHAGQKFELFMDESIAPSRLLSSAAGAGIDQARDVPAAYKQGMSGYGKRFGSSIATAASSNFFGTFVLASMLRQDPRYFPTLRGGFGHRVGYALSRIVITRNDQGAQTANWSGLVGPLLAESLATSYIPVSEQTVGKTFRRYGIGIGFTTATNILREYWPTIFRSLRLRKVAPGLKPDAARP